jgi:H+-translocating NAD(P) transhydrogenase subunit alpha
MFISVVKERNTSEKRVGLVPETVGKLTKAGHTVAIEKDAGASAFFSDEDYTKAGAQVMSQADLYSKADLLVKVGALDDVDIEHAREGLTYIAMARPLDELEQIKKFAAKKANLIPMELIPRTTRAQRMDALSSQASIAGYKSVILAAENLCKYFPMLTTAAGTIMPARVFVLGAGVAGLQAIATAKRLGARVEAFDVRPAVKTEVESLGAKFVEVKIEEDTQTDGGYAKELTDEAKKKSQEMIAKHVSQSDVIITTAQVPGRTAPRMVTEDMIENMQAGSVVIDLAAENGGNCAYSKFGETIVHNGVVVIGPENIVSSMPFHASQLYSRNVEALLALMVGENKELILNFEDEIIAGACAVHAGEIKNERMKSMIEG